MYNVYTLFDVTPEKGVGAYVYDHEGTEYLDFYGGHAVISVGHSHPSYVAAIQDQIAKIGFYSNSVINPLQQALADRLASVSGMRGYDLFLINSGAEANDNALKLASFYKGRKKILALHNGFHGRTSAAINVTHTGQKHQAPINHGVEVTYCDHDDIQTILEEINTSQYAGIIIEAIQGVGGLDMISDGYLPMIKKACDATDTILIMDEVQCGYGRSGHFFAFQSADIRPDIISMAKGMGNGFPIGGILINADKMPAVKSQLGTTYGGNHLACRAASAVLDIIQEEKLIENARQIGGYLKESLSQLPHVVRIKGRGLMMGLELDQEVGDIRKKLVYDYKLFTGSSSDKRVLRLLPPLNITTDHADIFLDKITAVLHQI